MLDAMGETLQVCDKVAWADNRDDAGTVAGFVPTEGGWFAEIEPVDIGLGRQLPHLVRPHRLVKAD